jgi:ubiquitin-protein ligase
MKYLRLKKDIADIMRTPLNDNGIYYVHNETNFLKGHVLICGPQDTPYEFGFYFFDVLFPDNYPISPPKLTFKTYDTHNNTRFNPNLYRNGKVCISILNTWRGEGWTSCLTLKTVLLSVQTVLNKNPLMNEPNVNTKNPALIPYNIIVNYKNLYVAVGDTIQHIINNKNETFLIFKPIVIKLFLEKYDEIIEKILKLENSEIDNNNQVVNMYNMNCNINYSLLLEYIKKLKIELENNK